MIHRAILGSLERFIGVMIEHYAGAFPMWLAPEQIRLATVSDDYIAFAKELAAKLDAVGLRVQLDDSPEKVGKKIRNAAIEKVPWTIVIGEKEVAGEDFQVKVFGSETALSIKQNDLIEAALQQAKLPN